MADTFLQLPLRNLVDLVINSPEEGIVNFNLLHTLLHVLVQQMKAQDISVELHGETAARLQNILKENPQIPSVNITEIVVTDSGKKVKKEPTVMKDTATETVLVVEPVDSSHNVGQAVTKKQLDDLYDEIEDLKERIKELVELPANMGIIECVRSEQSPVVDVLQLLNLSKRIDAAEVGMNKLASIVEDVIKAPIAPVKNTVCKPRKGSGATNTPVRSSKSDLSDDVIANLVEDVEKLKSFFPDIFKQGSASEISESEMTPNPIAQLFKDVAELKARFFVKKKDEGEDDDEQNLPPEVLIVLLQNKVNEMNEYLERLDTNFNDDITKLHSQFTDIEKDFNEIINKFQGGMPGGDTSVDEPNRCCGAVYQKIVKLQSDFDDLTGTSVKLLEDNIDRAKRMDELLEQIEMLKLSKMDREDVEEALADKADACTVHRKVSHDQFDTACDELTKGIEETLERLQQQEVLWQQALDDIQTEIGNKLDKMDLGPLREFINNKLKMLQDKMRSLAALKREQEAAGSKNKILRNVNCISCEKDVIMRKEMDSTLRPKAYALPPTRSMAPYLAYELDALRKQQRGVPGGKNLHHFEHALAMEKGGKGKGEDHICNRYCGGSHTVTTPQQRVTRLGHFLVQWGAEAQPPVPEIKFDEKPSSVQPKTSVVVHGDIVSARKSQTMEDKIKSSSVGKISKSKLAPKSSRESMKKSSSVEAKRVSQASVKSVRSQRSKGSKEKLQGEIPEETALEIAAEDQGDEEATEIGDEGEGDMGDVIMQDEFPGEDGDIEAAEAPEQID